jgi:ketosteroid isomerase-like protein
VRRTQPREVRFLTKWFGGLSETRTQVGNGPDAAAFDPGTGLAFSSNGGDGTLSIVKMVNGTYDTVDTVQTERGERTMTLDPKTHKVYLLAAEFGPAPEAQPGQKKGRAPILTIHAHPNAPCFRIICGEGKMKEQENTTLIKNIYAAFARGDIQMILGHVTNETDWIFEAPANVPYGGKRKGSSQIIGFFQGLDNSCTDMKLSPEQFIAQGDSVATFGRFSGMAKASGTRFDVPYGHYFQIQNGKIVHYINLSDTAVLSGVFGSATGAAR